MKRLFGIIIVILLMCLLSACNQPKSNTISAVDLTDREETILDITSENGIVFDYNLESDFKEVSVWIERYDSGKFVDDKISHITTDIGKTGSIIFASPKSNEDDKELTFNIGVGDENDAASISGVDTKLKGLDEMTSAQGQLNEEKTFDDEEIVLANICYSSDENGMSSLSSYFYDGKVNIKELEQYDVTYILKAQFKK